MVRNQRAKRAEEGGIALILCLLVLAILIVLITQFAWTAKVERTVARNAKDDLKMLFAARSLVSYTKAFLRADRASPTGNPLDSRREDWAQIGQDEDGVRGDMPPLDAIGDVQIESMRLVDCERFLNVNLLADQTTRAWAAEVLGRLAGRLQLPKAAEVVERIVDFVDDDAQGQYEAGARNGPLFHPHELLGMQDVKDDPELMAALVGWEDQQMPGTRHKGLCDFLTTFGTQKININTMPYDLAWALVGEQKGTPPVAVTEAERDQAVTELQTFRTGQAPAGTSTSTSASTGSSLIQMGASQATGGEGQQRPGEDFKQVAEIEAKVALFKGALGPATAPGPTGPGPTGPGPTGTGAMPSLRRFLDVASRDFHLRIVARRGTLTRKAFECILRRGTEEFDVLLWREVPVPPQPVAMDY